jgi:hypothetical protein
LAAQAIATADQALQLARLAEASARLAHQLHAQAFRADGRSPPDVHEVHTDNSSPESSGGSEQAERALVTAAPPMSSARRRRGPRRARRLRERLARLERTASQSSPPQQVRITTERQNLKRKAAPIREFIRKWTSVTLSTSVHIAVLLLLAMMTFSVRSEPAVDTVLASIVEEEPIVEEELPLDEPLEDEPPPETPEPPPPEEPVPAEPLEQPLADELPQPPDPMEADAPPTPGPDPAAQPAVDLAQVGSRSEAGKALLLERYGGTAASETAVQRALEWLASRQRRDGSWNFNDVGPCSHAGSVDNPMGATAYVLLCYLGAGHTEQGGPFQNNVRTGLKFLIDHGRRVPAGGDFRGADCREHDNFYVQAPVAMVLSEALQMSKNRQTRRMLQQPAQLAVDFLCHAQDPQGGGWRYQPQEPGCTSVTVLVAMALKSADNAGLTVPPRVWDGISHYLDTVRSDQPPTGRYGYRVAEPNYRISTTSMALLCRMYLGWSKDHSELQQGVALLDQRGPYDNLYYCYYATQVMRHWGGEEWQRWNPMMRDDLLRTQVTANGPELGSWMPRDRSGYSLAGGRLFTTCLATTTLEVYYRYLPLYGLMESDDSVAIRAPDATDDR